MCCDTSIVVPSSIAAHFAFCFTSCAVMLAFWHLQQLPSLLSVLLVVIMSSGPRMPLVGCKNYLKSPVFYSTDRFKTVVTV